MKIYAVGVVFEGKISRKLQHFLRKFGAPEGQSSCIKMCKNPVMQKRTKHIDIKYHFIQERVDDCTLEHQFCPIEEMSADFLTKPLVRTKVEKHLDRLLGESVNLREVQPEWWY